jgi:hypothetical protein
LGVVEKVKGREAWSYDTICTVCRASIAPDEDVYVVGMHVIHEDCLSWLLDLRESRFREALKSLPLDARKELEELYKAKKAQQALQAPKQEQRVAPKELEEPDPVVLTREQRKILWQKARVIVSNALGKAGLRFVGEMRVDGMSTETYPRFVMAIRDRVTELLKEPRRLELKLHTYLKGFGDTDVYIDGEYLYTWRPIEPYVGAFQNWVHRVYNLLKTLAERGLLREEALKSEGGSAQSGSGGSSSAEEDLGDALDLGDAFIEWEGAPH